MTVHGSEELYGRVSALAASMFPEFVREEGPRFVQFFRAYLEASEAAGGPIRAVRALPDLVDVDRSPTAGLARMKSEQARNYPESALADPRLLVKYSRELGRARGSEASMRAAFRALYDVEIDVRYPGDHVLRASDGRWVRETIVRATAPLVGDPYALAGKRVTGVSSLATGIVQSVALTHMLGIPTYQLVIENVDGTFSDGETVSDPDGNSARISSSAGELTGASLTRRGAYHAQGDSVIASGETSGSAAGTVTATTDRSALTFRIVRGGSGYRIANTTLSVSGGSGRGAAFSILTLSNTSSMSLNQDLIGPMRNVAINAGRYFASGGANTASVRTRLTGTLSGNTTSNTVSGSGTAFTTQLSAGTLVRVHGVANTVRVHSVTSATAFVVAHRPPSVFSAAAGYIKLAGANSTTVLSHALSYSTVTVGSIASLRVLAPGDGYDGQASGGMPTVTAVDHEVADTATLDAVAGGIKGRNAVIVANNAPGAMAGVSVSTSSADFAANELIRVVNQTTPAADVVDSYSDAQGLTRTTTHAGTFSANGVPTLAGSIRLGGRYVGTSGLLSSSSRLQDNQYYQAFSYAVRAALAIDTYRESIRRLVHPAGTRMFGVCAIDGRVDLSAGLDVELDGYARLGSGAFDLTADLSNVIISSSITETQIQAPEVPIYMPSANSASMLRTFKLAAGVVAVQVANSIIASYASLAISPYAAIPIGYFDGNPRLVISTTSPHLAFGGGALMANTGSISVGGRGANLMMVSVSRAQANGLYQVNTIFSNSAMALRRDFLGGALSNGHFYYQTGITGDA